MGRTFESEDRGHKTDDEPSAYLLDPSRERERTVQASEAWLEGRDLSIEHVRYM
jgi:hypothetical protein